MADSSTPDYSVGGYLYCPHETCTMGVNTRWDYLKHWLESHCRWFPFVFTDRYQPDIRPGVTSREK